MKRDLALPGFVFLKASKGPQPHFKGVTTKRLQWLVKKRLAHIVGFAEKNTSDRNVD